MTIVSLQGEEMIFFFNENASTFFEEDIFTADNSSVDTSAPFTKTMLYSGDYPAATPKTGAIQAPSDVALIIPPSLTFVKTGAGTITVTILASDTVDTDDGTTLLVVGDLIGVTTTSPITRTLVLPANKFLTIKAEIVSGSSALKVEDGKTVERGSLTRDIDPLLQ